MFQNVKFAQNAKQLNLAMDSSVFGFVDSQSDSDVHLYHGGHYKDRKLTWYLWEGGLQSIKRLKIKVNKTKKI